MENAVMHIEKSTSTSILHDFFLEVGARPKESLSLAQTLSMQEIRVLD